MQKVIAYVAGLLVAALVVFFGIRLTADHSTALDRFKNGSPATTTTVDLGPAPAPGQVFVKGPIERLTAEKAQAAAVAVPFTLNAVERGVGKATIENALVDGKRTSIVWGGGTPLPITGTGGAIDLSGSKVDADATGLTWTVDGARALRPGAYRAGAPVAVGVGGLATPRDSVAFTADAQTIITARNGVVVKVPPAPVELKGPGKVTATGQLQIRDQTTRKPAGGFQFGEGPYTITLTPVDGRLEVDAVLQGPLTRS
jgi:hypothetical protein